MESRIIEGDCLQVMKTLEDNSIDSIVTDPPYGYSFMGKDWDRAVPSVEVWRECLRVLKPGAFCLVMSAPRSDVQCAMISRLQEAGFRLDFTPIYWTYATGFPKASNMGKQDTQLEGAYAGYQPKPALEIVIVAMRPCSEKTYIGQAMENGHGITWLDDCRIPIGDDDRHEYGIDGDEGEPIVNSYSDRSRVAYSQHPKGRFPANLLVEDNVLGDYSKFFTLPFLIVPKASKGEKNKGLDDFEEKEKSHDYRKPTGNPMVDRIHGLNKKKNHHPTVKPLKLMSYLITLTSHPGDLILDPFVGSGTSCIAAKQLDRKYIGIEREAQYVEIANARLDAVDDNKQISLI